MRLPASSRLPLGSGHSWSCSKGYIGNHGIYGDNGKENGKYHLGLGFYRGIHWERWKIKWKLLYYTGLYKGYIRVQGLLWAENT